MLNFRLNNQFKQLMSIHWWMAGCYLLLFPSGIAMMKLDREVSHRELLFNAHISVGVLVLLLLGWRAYLLLRVWGRKYRNKLPKLTTNWYVKTGLHTVLYLLMFVVPLSGYWLVNSEHASRVYLFGLSMPDLFPVNVGAIAPASLTHGITSKVFALLILIHAIAQRHVIRANWRRLLTWLQKFWQQG